MSHAKRSSHQGLALEALFYLFIFKIIPLILALIAYPTGLQVPSSSR